MNGKPSVIYLGAISCVYCGENRWAMALALGQFGSFQHLFKGYSSLGDADVPTIYWAPAEYNVTQGVDFGNFYTSNYINFLSMDYASPITEGFMMGSLTYFQQQATSTMNPAYEDADEHDHQAEQLRRHAVHDLGEVQRARGGREQLRGLPRPTPRPPSRWRRSPTTRS